MEESSDESAELIDKEEAVKAEQQYVAQTQAGIVLFIAWRGRKTYFFLSVKIKISFLTAKFLKIEKIRYWN